MSTIAAETVVQLGYSNVRNLEEGMIAWEEEDHPLLQSSIWRPGRRPGLLS